MPENYSLRLGQIEFSAGETYALCIKEMKIGDITKGLSSIKYISGSVYTKNTDYQECDIAINRDLSGVLINDERKMKGYFADNVRPYYYYTASDKREDYIKDHIRQQHENANPANIIVTNYDLSFNLDEVPMTIRFELNEKSLLEKAGDKLLLKVGEVIGRQMELYQEKERINDIDINYPHQYQRKITVKIPAGYKLVNPEVSKINFNYTDSNQKDLMGFISNGNLENDIFTINVNEYYAFTTLSKTRFNEFKNVINGAADFNKIVLIFEPIK